MAIPKRVAERITAGMKKLMPILQQQKSRDVSEADTVTLVKDLLSEVFGYDKYTELTGQLAIRGTYCDLAIKIEDKLTQLIEVKAIGITLDDRHLKQVVDYAANQGAEWVLLTNGAVWRLYNILFLKPIDKRLVCEIDLQQLDVKKEAHLDQLYVFCKEGYLRGVHEALRDRQVATSKHLIAALVLHNEDVLSVLRRELRKIVEVFVDTDEIVKVLLDDVIKRDAMEDPSFQNACTRVRKNQAKRPKVQKEIGSFIKPIAMISEEPAPEELLGSTSLGHLAPEDLGVLVVKDCTEN